jgi:hypothetical protein
MRTEIALLAGPREWGDNKKGWLSRVPRAVKRALGTDKETVTYRMVKSLWYGEITDPDHHAARDVRRAAKIMAARREALGLAEKYRALARGMNEANADFFGEDVARLERVARMLGGLDRPD